MNAKKESPRNIAKNFTESASGLLLQSKHRISRKKRFGLQVSQERRSNEAFTLQYPLCC